jgi:hypothetical protein
VFIVSRPSSRPQFWNLNPSDFFVRLLHIDSLHPARLVFVFAVPIILCWLITERAKPFCKAAQIICERRGRREFLDLSSEIQTSPVRSMRARR